MYMTIYCILSPCTLQLEMDCMQSLVDKESADSNVEELVQEDCRFEATATDTPGDRQFESLDTDPLKHHGTEWVVETGGIVIKGGTQISK